MEQQQPNVESYLANAQPRHGGRTCPICASPKSPMIDAALTRFADMRIQKKTLISWKQFCEEYLTKQLGVKNKADCIKRHTEKCLGREIK